MQAQPCYRTLPFGSEGRGRGSATPVAYRKEGCLCSNTPAHSLLKWVLVIDNLLLGQSLRIGSQLWHSFKFNVTLRSVYLEEPTLSCDLLTAESSHQETHAHTHIHSRTVISATRTAACPTTALQSLAIFSTNAHLSHILALVSLTGTLPAALCSTGQSCRNTPNCLHWDDSAILLHIFSLFPCWQSHPNLRSSEMASHSEATSPSAALAIHSLLKAGACKAQTSLERL